MSDSGNTLYQYELEIPGDESLSREEIEKRLGAFVHHPDGVWCTMYEDGVATVVSPDEIDFRTFTSEGSRYKVAIEDLRNENLQLQNKLDEMRRENEELRQKIRRLRAGENYREKVNEWIKENNPEFGELSDLQKSILTEIDKRWGRGPGADSWTISEVADEGEFSEDMVRQYVYEFRDSDWVEEVRREEDGLYYCLGTNAPWTPARWDSDGAVV